MSFGKALPCDQRRPFDLPRYIRASARSVEKPCTEEKRFTNTILDYSQLLSSTLNITQEECEKLHRVQAQGSVVPGKRKVLHLLHIEPAYYGHFLWSPKCLVVVKSSFQPFPSDFLRFLHTGGIM